MLLRAGLTVKRCLALGLGVLSAVPVMAASAPIAAETLGSSGDALVVIDLQRCFLPGGSLAVPNGEQVVPVINRLAQRFDTVVLTQDWHPPAHVSFASSHPGKVPFSTVPMPYGLQTLWPEHCLQNTAGAELTPALQVPHARLIVRKGYRRQLDSYSALLEADGRSHTGLDAWLRSQGIRRLVLVGLATDYCVLATALDARRLGYDVVVVEEATRGVNRDGSLQRAWQKMEQAGVKRLSVRQIKP